MRVRISDSLSVHVERRLKLLLGGVGRFYRSVHGEGMVDGGG